MIVYVSVSLFENKPERCPFGHELWPGKAQVSWTPCICEPAREAAGRGRGMGHVRVICNSCHDRLWQTVFYEPPHDSGRRPLTGWVTTPDPRSLALRRRRPGQRLPRRARPGRQRKLRR